MLLQKTSPIQPFKDNPWYWEYHGEPILLRGGSDDDNPFQWTGKKLTDHLDLLVSVHGNYMRNTMSDRDEGNVFAYAMNEEGIYDLSRWNDEYWKRLKFYLDETNRRGIIVQLTVWDVYDRERSPDDPWRAQNNLNYEDDVITGAEDFFNTVELNNETGLRYQRKYVDKLLSISLEYDHILYNINNESMEGEIWENYWAKYLLSKAEGLNRKIYVTTMQFDPGNSVRTAMTFPDIYSYAEVSQNNQDSRGGRGQGHWDNLINWRRLIESQPDGPMPMNNVKVYGGKDAYLSAGSEEEAIDRFWRNIIAGCASTRFHRPTDPPTWGSGLNEHVQITLKAVDMFLEQYDIFASSPQNELLWTAVAAAPSSMEAYTSAIIGKQYAVYFPEGRYMVNLDPWVYAKKVEIRWLDIDNLTWSDAELVNVEWEGGQEDWGYRGKIRLKTPGNRRFLALVKLVE